MKAWTVLPLLAASGVVSLPALAEGPFVRVVGEPAQIPVDRAVGDLLVVDGGLDLDGVVRGHLFAIDAEVTLGPDAVVLGSVTLVRGALKLDPASALPAEVRLEGTHVHGAPLEPGERRTLPGGAVLAQASDAPSDAAVALMKDVLTFDRFGPPDGTTVRELRAWHPGMGLEVKRFVERPPKLVVGGVTRLSFVSEKVQGSFQRGYRGPMGSVLVSGVKLADLDAAKALWAQVQGVEARAGVELSVQSDLGPGAHWFFRKKGRYVMLWQRGPWFFGVESRLAKPDAAAADEKRFLYDVLGALRAALSPVPDAASGFTRGNNR